MKKLKHLVEKTKGYMLTFSKKYGNILIYGTIIIIISLCLVKNNTASITEVNEIFDIPPEFDLKSSNPSETPAPNIIVFCLEEYRQHIFNILKKLFLIEALENDHYKNTLLSVRFYRDTLSNLDKFINNFLDLFPWQNLYFKTFKGEISAEIFQKEIIDGFYAYINKKKNTYFFGFYFRFISKPARLYNITKKYSFLHKTIKEIIYNNFYLKIYLMKPLIIIH